MNINFGLFPPLTRNPARDGAGHRLRGTAKAIAKKQALAARALDDFAHWLEAGTRAAAE
jgi:methylenetetrahydrofolate--tRNA-(uracil-5-)-methyltransferase